MPSLYTILHLLSITALLVEVDAFIPRHWSNVAIIKRRTALTIFSSKTTPRSEAFHVIKSSPRHEKDTKYCIPLDEIGLDEWVFDALKSALFPLRFCSLWVCVFAWLSSPQSIYWNTISKPCSCWGQNGVSGWAHLWAQLTWCKNSRLVQPVLEYVLVLFW